MRTTICFVLLALTGVSSAGDKKGPDLRADEEAILKLTNAERKKAGLPPLKINATLCKVARADSANMLKQGKVTHELDGKGPRDRVKAGGYKYEVCGENVGHTTPGATGKKEGSTNEDMMKWWMNSPAHKANILHKEYAEIGIGIAETEKGERYFTQLFGSPYVPD